MEELSLTHFIVSRKVFLSVISSGIRLRIRLRDADFLLSSWKASSDRLSRYSIKSESEAAPWRRRMLSFMLTLISPLRIMPITRSYVSPGWVCSAFVRAALSVCEATTSRLSSCQDRESIGQTCYHAINYIRRNRKYLSFRV